MSIMRGMENCNKKWGHRMRYFGLGSQNANFVYFWKYKKYIYLTIFLDKV